VAGHERAPDGAASSEPPQENTARLPQAAEELARSELHRIPMSELGDDHKRRVHEAIVREHETHAKQADDDRAMRKDIAERVFRAISVQVVIADVAFLIYGFGNEWHVPAGTIGAWLGATVIQVIAVGLVIARSLFPNAR
jgi:hypothetical protein